MATRADRIDRARDLIAGNPNITKRFLQSRLREEFGVGLSDTMRRSLLQTANTPAVLRARVRTPAFTHRERVILNKVIRRSGNASYVVKAINDRFLRAKEARDSGMERREFMRLMRQEAKGQGLLAIKTTRSKENPDGQVKGQIDWWRKLREYRDKDIKKGDYVPLPSPKPTIDKGRIKDQKYRWRERQAGKVYARNVERKRIQVQNWIRQLDSRIRVAGGERREQLYQQRRNLERTLASIK